MTKLQACLFIYNGIFAVGGLLLDLFKPEYLTSTVQAVFAAGLMVSLSWMAAIIRKKAVVEQQSLANTLSTLIICSTLALVFILT